MSVHSNNHQALQSIFIFGLIGKKAGIARKQERLDVYKVHAICPTYCAQNLLVFQAVMRWRYCISWNMKWLCIKNILLDWWMIEPLNFYLVKWNRRVLKHNSVNFKRHKEKNAGCKISIGKDKRRLAVSIPFYLIGVNVGISCSLWIVFRESFLFAK